MKTYLTQLTAINQLNGELRIFAGPNIHAPTAALAQAECEQRLPYLKVIGELVCEVDMEGNVEEYNHALN